MGNPAAMPFEMVRQAGHLLDFQPGGLFIVFCILGAPFLLLFILQCIEEYKYPEEAKQRRLRDEAEEEYFKMLDHQREQKQKEGDLKRKQFIESYIKEKSTN